MKHGLFCPRQKAAILGADRGPGRAWGTRSHELRAHNPFWESREMMGPYSLIPSDFTYKTQIQRESD